MNRFTDRTVVVTGGGGGIGTAVCTSFAEEGAKVAVLDRASRLQPPRPSHHRRSGTAIAIGCDITERSSVDAGIDHVNSELGCIDALVNNAGWDLFVPFVDTQPEDWSRLIDINLIGALHMHHAVIPRMIDNGGGRIVNVSIGCRSSWIIG